MDTRRLKAGRHSDAAAVSITLSEIKQNVIIGESSKPHQNESIKLIKLITKKFCTKTIRPTLLFGVSKFFLINTII